MTQKRIKHYYGYKLTQPGEYTSVDQLKSPTPGIITQLTRKLTTKRYNIETTFVDQTTRFIYANLKTTDSSEENIKAKQAFKLMAQQHGFKINAYHADNGIFQDHSWGNSCAKQYTKLPGSTETHAASTIY